MKQMFIFIITFSAVINGFSIESGNKQCNRYSLSSFWYRSDPYALSPQGNGDKILFSLNNSTTISPKSEISKTGFSSIGSCYKIPLTTADEINSEIYFYSASTVVVAIKNNKADLYPLRNTLRIDEGNPDCLNLQESIKLEHSQDIVSNPSLDYDEITNTYLYPNEDVTLKHRRILLTNDKKYLLTVSESKHRLTKKQVYEVCAFNAPF